MVQINTINKWIKDYPELCYQENVKEILCTACDIRIKQLKKDNIDKHIRSKNHKLKTAPPEISYETFCIDLLMFLISANIPWHQLNNSRFRAFFKKYLWCPWEIPDESYIRKKILGEYYGQKMQELKNIMRDEFLWISIDETKNRHDKNAVNIILRNLTLNGTSCCYLLASKILDVVNGETIANFIREHLKLLWDNNFESNTEKLLMLSTDSAAYMLKAGKLLKEIFPNMLHVTCIAHGLHRVCEQIRCEFPNVDLLISNVKKIFRKAPNRVKFLKSMYPNIPLPPRPVITRWGTWLEAALYYHKYFTEISNVLTQLSKKEAKSISKAQSALQNQNIRQNLDFISTNYEIIKIALQQVQSTQLSVTDSLLILDQVRIVLHWVASETVKNKMEYVLDRNPDYENIRDICEKTSQAHTVRPLDMFFNGALLTSVDTERSFSIYKWIYSDNRNRLKPENLEKILFLYVNNTL